MYLFSANSRELYTIKYAWLHNPLSLPHIWLYPLLNTGNTLAFVLSYKYGIWGSIWRKQWETCWEKLCCLRWWHWREISLQTGQHAWQDMREQIGWTTNAGFFSSIRAVSITYELRAQPQRLLLSQLATILEKRVPVTGSDLNVDTVHTFSSQGEKQGLFTRLCACLKYNYVLIVSALGSKFNWFLKAVSFLIKVQKNFAQVTKTPHVL